MLPALIVIAIGLDPTYTLVLSQVALSFVLPCAVIPLMYFTMRRSVMGDMVNRRWTTILGWVVTTIIISLNFFLLYQTFLAG